LGADTHDVSTWEIVMFLGFTVLQWKIPCSIQGTQRIEQSDKIGSAAPSLMMLKLFSPSEWQLVVSAI
jgi:hypothetical protein